MHVLHCSEHRLLKRYIFPQAVSENLNESYIRFILDNMGTELCAVCSVMGGIVAQQVIRAMSRKNAPLCNWLLFDTAIGNAVSMNVGCK